MMTVYLILAEGLARIVFHGDSGLQLNLLVGQIGTEEIVAPVRGGDASHLAHDREIQPLIVITLGLRIIVGKKGRIFHIPRFEVEDDRAFFLTVVLAKATGLAGT